MLSCGGRSFASQYILELNHELTCNLGVRTTTPGKAFFWDSLIPIWKVWVRRLSLGNSPPKKASGFLLVLTRTRTHVLVYIHTYLHTYTHTHIKTQTDIQASLHVYMRADRQTNI